MPTDQAAPMTARERIIQAIAPFIAVPSDSMELNTAVTAALYPLLAIAREDALTEHTAAVTAELAEAKRRVADLEKELRARVNIELTLCEACIDNERCMAGSQVELEDRAEAAERRVAELQKVLREHHEHELNSGTIGLQDGEGGWIELDNGAEYSDSLMYQRTEAALAGMPPDEVAPMPRGGVSVYWWQTAILQRRKLKAAEQAVTAETERCVAIIDTLRNGYSWQQIIAAIRGRATPAGQGEAK